MAKWTIHKYSPSMHVTPNITIDQAIATIRQGQLIAIPTETVYGLAADAMNPIAINRIFALKGRPADHPLIVHIADANQMPIWAIDIPDVAYRLADVFWPGPLTFILKKQPGVPLEVTGGQNTIALRCPDNALTLELLQRFGGGLAAPSANRFGRISPTTAEHVRAEFGIDAPPILDAGPCKVGIESTIVDLSARPFRILRPGKIRYEQLLPFLPELQMGSDVTSPRVSGALESHYAPSTPIHLQSRSEIESNNDKDAVALTLVNVPDGIKGLCLPAQAEAYAWGFYSSLRRLDEMQASRILLEQTPSSNEWLAINDRIKRAVAGSS
jgi:L-threonylcarbamoyladenylate synthase